MNSSKTTYFFFIWFFISTNSFAGFLEMPEISEVPDMERRSLVRDVDIPGVRERSPDPEAGPRVAVSAFRLQGMVEFPELGITKADLDKIVEEIRADMMNEGKLLDSGYTIDELGEVSDLLVKIEEETMDRHVGALEVQQLVWLVRDQRSKRGITLGQMESVADKITSFYREKGFILAKAYIPKQEVRDGIVTLTMQLGLLGEVDTVDNIIYNDNLLKRPFTNILTKPVTNNQIEERLFLINDYPGINVSGFFEPGSQVGDTKLNVKVNGEQRYSGNLRLDNHGTEETGKQRFYADMTVNNPIGIADYVQVGFLSAASPSNTTYYLLRYNTNLYNPRLYLDLLTSTNQFVVDQSFTSDLGGLELSGDTTQSYLSMLYKIKRSRVSNHTVGLKQESIESDIALGSNQVDFLDAKVINNSLFYNYDLLNEKDQVLHQGSVSFINGEFEYGEVLGQEDTYNILVSDYTYLSFWKIPYFDSNSRIIFRSALQLSDSALSSLNQFFLAGATRARGFVTNQFSADNAAYIGFDWIFNSPDIFDFKIFGETKFRDISQPFFFVDASYGVKKSLVSTEDDETAQISDAGIGLRFNYLNDFTGNIQFAVPINNKFTNSDITDIDDGMKVVFEFQYSFL